MPLVCLLLPVLFWPGFAESSNTPKWIFLSAVLPFFLTGTWSRGHTIGLAFLGWCYLTLTWAPPYEAGYRLWQFTILGLAFCAGSSLDRKTFRRCILGFGFGVLVSVPLAIAQLYGFDWVNQAVKPAGLFMNKNYLAEAALLAGVGALCLRHWLWAPLGAGMLVPASAGVLLAVTLVLAKRFARYYKTVLLVLVIVAVAGYLRIQGSEFARVSLWANSLASVTFEGHGIGSYWSVFPKYHDAVMATDEQIYRPGYRPRTAHNDALTVLIETGVPGLLLAVSFFGYTVTRRRSTNEHTSAHYIVLAFLAEGLVAFPLYVPSTAFMAFLAAGFLCGGGNRDGNISFRRRGVFRDVPRRPY